MGIRTKGCLLLLLLFLCFFHPVSVYAQGSIDGQEGKTGGAQTEEETFDFKELYDLEAIDREVGREFGGYTFSEIVENFQTGDVGQGMSMIKSSVIQIFFEEVVYEKKAVVRILLLAVLSAMISNLSVLINKSDISETGFFMVYMLMAITLIQSFQVIMDMIFSVTDSLLTFIKIVIPSMILSVGLCCGQTTALGFGEITMFVIYVGETVITNIVLPAISVYVILMLMNHLMTDDYLSRFGGIFKGFVIWFIKCFTGIVMGMNLIKGMILPGVDNMSRNTAVRLVNLIPGAEELTGVGSIFLSSAVVIKNAIGGAVILCMVILAAVPCIKMLVFVGVYRISAALIQPMADKRIARCVDTAADGVMLLNKVLIAQVLMGVLSVAVLCMVTS